MLVLKRRAGESVIINEQVRILVVNTGNGACKLAFDAPASDRIRRAEVPPIDEDRCLTEAVARRIPK